MLAHAGQQLDQLNRWRIPFAVDTALMPVRIRRHRLALSIQFRHLSGSQFPVDRAEILLELLFIARPDNERVKHCLLAGTCNLLNGPVAVGQYPSSSRS